MSKRVEKKIYNLNGLDIPLQIHYENRNSYRASVGAKAVYFRLPHLISVSEKKKAWGNFKKWLQKNEETLVTRFGVKTYKTGDVLQVGKRKYTLKIKKSNNKSHSGKLENETVIALKINHDLPNANKATKALLSRTIGQDFQAEIQQRVQTLNQLHFKVKVNNVRLKYTRTCWGSCSSQGNLNFSTRILFAPDDVIDYVIIHELAHRLEMNHSPRFWQLVSDAMPSYKEKELWLDTHGKDCDF